MCLFGGSHFNIQTKQREQVQRDSGHLNNWRGSVMLEDPLSLSLSLYHITYLFSSLASWSLSQKAVWDMYHHSSRSYDPNRLMEEDRKEGKRKQDVSQRKRNTEAKLFLTEKWLQTRMRDKKEPTKAVAAHNLLNTFTYLSPSVSFNLFDRL